MGGASLGHILIVLALCQVVDYHAAGSLVRCGRSGMEAGPTTGAGTMARGTSPGAGGPCTMPLRDS
jgi:hypothetical protein